MNWADTRDFLSPCFPDVIQAELSLLQPGELREIRIRADRPAMLITAARTAQVDWQPGQHQLAALTEALSGHSLYAREHETSQGFLTLMGGHRMGLCGRVTRRGDRPQLAEIGSLCIRIASEWPGAADALLPHLGSGSVLMVGPPGSGKTTILRDLARQLSNGRHPRQVALVDERGEMAACVNGIPQLDTGSADVLDGLPKGQAIPWLIRSMSPQVIITDELASEGDAVCLLDAQLSGAAICASVHGTSLTSCAARPAVAALMARRAFDLYAVLAPEGGGRIIALHDRSGSPLPLS